VTPFIGQRKALHQRVAMERHGRYPIFTLPSPAEKPANAKTLAMSTRAIENSSMDPIPCCTMILYWYAKWMADWMDSMDSMEISEVLRYASAVSSVLAGPRHLAKQRQGGVLQL
jgi:hypothetical protein